MKSTPQAWLLVVGRNSARLLSCYRTVKDSVHVDEHDRCEERWEESQHGRPSGLAQTGDNHYAYASSGHADEERLRRFAKQVIEWLEQRLQSNGIDKLDLFADPKLLGELRKVVPKRLGGRISDHAVDLASFGAGDLGRHAAVGRVCPPRD